MKGLINVGSSDINLVNGLSLMWLLGKSILLKSASEAQEPLGMWGGVLRWGDVNIVFKFCDFP